MMLTPIPETVAQVSPFTSYVQLVSIDPGQNRYRFYRLQWQPSLVS